MTKRKPHVSRISGCLAGYLLICAGLTSSAQSTRDFAVDLKATVSTNVPRITLSWTQRQQAKIASQKIYRRLKGETVWPSPITLATNSTVYADSTAVAGVEYEYWMQRTFSGLSPSPAVGYLSAGVEVPMTEARGTLLLVVDNTMAAPLAAEVAQLQSDLAGDGWTVQTITALRTNTAANVKAQITAIYNADPVSLKMVYLLGHVPVPYSGNIAPDGHSDHVGAWPTDGYYGDMNGTWTDTSVNNTASSGTRNDNVPGDGKFDQGNLPSAQELMVGRVDLHSMTRAPSSAVTETMLLRRYLRKAHDYRFKQGAYTNIPRRSILRDGFGYFSGEAFAISGWSWMFSSVGLTVDEVPSGQWFSASYAGGKDYLVGYGNGGGSYESAGSVGNTVNFGLEPSRAVFTSLFGSYFGDWDSGNNFLRAPLAGNATGDSLGLTCFWGGRPARFMHHLGMGETVGFSTMMSHNSPFWGANNNYQPNSYAGSHCGLMGDPALRLHIVEPPRHLTAFSSNTRITLGWRIATETNFLQGYHVYRSATPTGSFARLTSNAITAPTFTDTGIVAGQSYSYLVKTLKLETVPGGSYHNLSVGSPITLTARSAATAAPRNPTALTVSPSNAVSAKLTWTDNSGDETAFRIERKTGAGGAFSLLSNAAANTLTFVDTGPFTGGTTYYYRVIASNAAGDSPPSDEASFDAIAGYFDLPATRMKVSKTSGAATITVKRFGGATGSANVNYATSDSSAIAGIHYKSTSGTLTWADGESGSKTISVPISNTVLPQAARQFKVVLSSPSGGAGLTINSSVAVLIEDPTATLASPWKQTILGSITDYSPAVLTNGVFGSVTIGGSGLSSGSTSDNGRFIFQNRTGDGILTAYFPAGIPNDGSARVALMIRAATNNASIMAAAATSASTSFGSLLSTRSATGAGTAVLPSSANTLTLPRWMRLTRAGKVFSAETSTNGLAWTVLGSAALSGLPDSAFWGLFHFSSDWSITSLGNYHLAQAQNLTFDSLPIPSMPTGLTAAVTSTTAIQLTWSSVQNASGYRIERSFETNSFAQIAAVDAASGATQTYTDLGLPSDTAYAYRVFAFNSSGTSEVSSVVYVATPRPNVVTTLTTEEAGAADATLRRDSATTPLGTAPSLSVAGFYYYDGMLWTTLTNAAKTYLRFNLAGVGNISSAQLKLTFTDARLFDLYQYYDIMVAQLNESSDLWEENNITWSNAPQNNTSSYWFTGTVLNLGELYEERLPAAGETISVELDASTLHNNRGANNLVTLALTQYYGASIDWAAREHATYAPPSLELSAASPLPSRPAFLTASHGWGWSVLLRWQDNATTETGFEVERSANGGAFARIQTLAANTTTFTDTTALPDTTYTYRVRATNASGASSWTPLATLSTRTLLNAPGMRWDAGGGNTLLSTRENWDLDITPPFDGTAFLNFALGGSTASINTLANIRGLGLLVDGDFTLAAGGGSLTLGTDGLYAANPNSVTQRTYAVTANIALAADQVWRVDNTGAGLASLSIAGTVSDGDSAFGIIKTGAGSLTLSGHNTYDGTTWVTNGGVLRVLHSNALGSTNGNTVVGGGAGLEIGGSVSIQENLTLNGHGAPDGAGALCSTDGTNRWLGPIGPATASRIRVRSGSRLTLAGGVTGETKLVLVPDAAAELAITNRPVLLGDAGEIFVNGTGTVALATAGNTFGTLEVAGATLRLDAANTLPHSVTLSLGSAYSPHATVDLNGNSQTVGQLKHGTVTSGSRRIVNSSAFFATLTVLQNTSSTLNYDGQLSGALHLVKAGEGTLILRGTNNTFTGTTVVSNGTLEISSGSSLGNSPSVIVAGGTLSLKSAFVIADNAALCIADGSAKVYINGRFQETVSTLKLGNTHARRGTWGPSGSGATHIDNSHFAGIGKINVLHGPESVITIR